MAAEKMMMDQVRSRNSRRINLRLANLLAAVLVAAGWSLWPTFGSLFAALTLPNIENEVVTKGSEQVQLDLQRTVQKHFLAYGVYLPLEDIMFTQKLLATNKDLAPALHRICGESLFAVWLPLVVRFPLIGERSTEWCWKVALKK